MPSSFSSIGCGRISRGTTWRMPLANSAVATAATARRDRRSVLAQRLMSALVLIPLVLAGVWLGSPYLEVLVAAFGAAMAWEWTGLCARGRAGAGGVVGRCRRGDRRRLPDPARPRCGLCRRSVPCPAVDPHRSGGRARDLAVG